MNGRERIKAAIEFQETERPPHFEEMFELYEEAFGRGDMPGEEEFARATGSELDRMLNDCVEVYSLIVERFNWDAICVWRPWGGPNQLECIKLVKKALGDKVMVGGYIGRSIHSIDTTEDYMQFSIDIVEHPEKIHSQALEWSNSAIERGLEMGDAGADFINFVSDVAFNQGTFISPTMFREFCTP
jgi:uroporphyrinogen decarboxylase